MIPRVRRIIKKLRDNVVGGIADGWMLDQQVPLQSVYRSRFEYEIIEYGQPEIYAPTLIPDNPATQLKELKLHYNPQAMARPYYFHIKNAAVYKRQIVDPKNPTRVILESFPEGSMQDEGRNFRPELTHRRKALKHALHGTLDITEGYVFSSNWWKNYYHFLMDCCLRFIDLQEQGAFSEGTTLLLQKAPNAWQASYLRLLGLEHHKSRLTDRRPIKVERLLVASPRRHRFVVSPRAVDALRSRLFERLQIPDVEPTRRIFISRRGANRRRLLNESEVETCLRDHDFEIIAAQNLTVEDQISLFSQAKTIVAPHGAGLANMIYSRKPNVIELFPEDRWNIGYFLALTNSIGGIHVPIICEPENELDDFRVDLDALRKALNVTS